MAVVCVLTTARLWSTISLADNSFTAGFIGFTRLVFGLCFFAAWDCATRRSLRLPPAPPGAGRRW